MLGFILSNPTLLAVMAGIAGALMAFLKGNSRGARLERDRQARAEQRARDVADQVDNDIGALPPNRVREELKTW